MTSNKPTTPAGPLHTLALRWRHRDRFDRWRWRLGEEAILFRHVSMNRRRRYVKTWGGSCLFVAGMHGRHKTNFIQTVSLALECSRKRQQENRKEKVQEEGVKETKWGWEWREKKKGRRRKGFLRFDPGDGPSVWSKLLYSVGQILVWRHFVLRVFKPRETISLRTQCGNWKCRSRLAVSEWVSRV